MGAPEREYLSPEEAVQYAIVKSGQIYKEIRGKKYESISYRKGGKIHYRIPVRAYMQHIAKTVKEYEEKAVKLRQVYDALMRRLQHG